MGIVHWEDEYGDEQLPGDGLKITSKFPDGTENAQHVAPHDPSALTDIDPPVRTPDPVYAKDDLEYE